jgi:outer membrane lipoprotein-sorting protein
MRLLSRTPALRAAVPVLAAVVLLSGGWTMSQLTASAQSGLRPRTAARLLVDVQKAKVDGMSGTVVQRASLGLPDLPGGSGSSDLTSLVSGTHTLKVWLSGPDKARLSLLGTFGESDIVLNGRDLWTWSSSARTATHRTLSHPRSQGSGPPSLGALPTTPQQAASQALKAIDPTTRVTTSGTAFVAGRRAYELVLEPRDASSLVGQVRIAIDGRTHIPLRVQVLARGASKPAFEVGFTHFDPTRPGSAPFRFNPPPGTRVTQQGLAARLGSASGRPSSAKHAGEAGPAPRVVGHGWTTVVVTQAPKGLAQGPVEGSSGPPGQLTQVMRALPKVSGAWGSGRLLWGTLFSAVLTDDGRVAVGAVAPEKLYAALAAR